MKNIFILLLVFVTIGATAQRNRIKNLHEKDGKIGIGTNMPDELLTVKGKIHTQEVLVDLNGAVAPDYVFESYFENQSDLNPNYTMLGLDEVALFVQKNHHLPGVPSAKDIEENGLSLKAMNLLLLEKIEELTLYAIEQKQEIEIMKKELNDLKGK